MKTATPKVRNRTTFGGGMNDWPEMRNRGSTSHRYWVVTEILHRCLSIGDAQSLCKISNRPMKQLARQFTCNKQYHLKA